jgi:hypothetical protein
MSAGVLTIYELGLTVRARHSLKRPLMEAFSRAKLAIQEILNLSSSSSSNSYSGMYIPKKNPMMASVVMKLHL